MGGGEERSGALSSYMDMEARVPQSHPLRVIRDLANEALAALAGEFAALYASTGRRSIPPEKLLRAMLLQAFYSIRAERQLMERLNFDLLFHWFVGLGIDDSVWDHSTFSKNRDRLLDGDVAAKFLAAVLAQPRVKHETHASTSDPDPRLYRKGAGKDSKLCFIGHALMEIRAGPACLDRSPRILSGSLPGFAERGACRFCRGGGRA